MTLHQAFEAQRMGPRNTRPDGEIQTFRAWLARQREVLPCFSPETWAILDATLNDLQIELRESGARTVEDLEAHRKAVAS